MESVRFGSSVNYDKCCRQYPLLHKRSLQRFSCYQAVALFFSAGIFGAFVAKQIYKLFNKEITNAGNNSDRHHRSVAFRCATNLVAQSAMGRSAEWRTGLDPFDPPRPDVDWPALTGRSSR